MTIKELLSASRFKMIALDDDPTGIQTVHGCLLITDWSAQNLKTAFEDECDFFYVLTNTRAMTATQAAEVTRSAMEAILEANKEFNYQLIFVSRSDSTLRGHFPLETDIMHECLEKAGIARLPLTVFAPAFIEVGRLSIDGTHYLKDGDQLIPVNETEFARDNVFAYHHARLQDYIAEKLGGKAFAYERFRKGDKADDLRKMIENLQGLINIDAATLDKAAMPAFLTVDADTYADLENFASCLLSYLSQDYRVAVLRTSSSLPKALSGIENKDLLSKDELIQGDNAHQGLFIVGSHVKKTTAQLAQLLACPQTKGIELSIEDILYRSDELLNNVQQALTEADSAGLTPVVFTARKEVRLDNADERQALGQKVSDFLVSIVEHLPYQPAYLVAKGGITSHDILTQGLSIRLARVMGQILPGVPCIRTDESARFAHLPYIIFPGNVGSENSLAEAFEKLK